MKRYPVLVKKSDEIDHQSRNLKIQKLLDEIVNDGNSTSSSRPYAVQIKRLFDDSDELFATDHKRSQKVLNESITKESKDTDEIINDSSLVKPHDEMKIPPRKKSVLSVAQEKTLPPGTVAAAVFQEMAAAAA